MANQVFYTAAHNHPFASCARFSPEQSSLLISVQFIPPNSQWNINLRMAGNQYRHPEARKLVRALDVTTIRTITTSYWPADHCFDNLRKMSSTASGGTDVAEGRKAYAEKTCCYARLIRRMTEARTLTPRVAFRRNSFARYSRLLSGRPISATLIVDLNSLPVMKIRLISKGRSLRLSINRALP
jgi:hypothetical protein